jgi:hypothetical protein
MNKKYFREPLKTPFGFLEVPFPFTIFFSFVTVLLLFFSSCAGLAEKTETPSEIRSEARPVAERPETPPERTQPAAGRTETPPERARPAAGRAETPPERIQPAAGRTETTPERIRPDRSPPEYIMGKGQVPQTKLVQFLEENNPYISIDFVENLAAYYIEEAAVEGVNYDTAFAQMCLETGFLRYGGLVTSDMNNFCGLGAIGPGQPGEVFPDPRTGVRAHIQHLKAYATAEPLKGVLVDPRYRWVRYGSSPTIHGLSGTWAADRSYSGKIGRILERLYSFSFSD